MLKYIAVLLAFAVLTVGCAKLPFSTVDSSESTRVSDDREVRLNSFELTEPKVQETQKPVSPVEQPVAPVPVFLLPENTRSTWNGHNWCTKEPNSSLFDACAPPPLCAPPTAIPGN